MAGQQRPNEVSAQLKEYVVTRIAELKKLDRSHFDELSSDFQHVFWAAVTPDEVTATRSAGNGRLGQLGEWRVERLREQVRKRRPTPNSRKPTRRKSQSRSIAAPPSTTAFHGASRAAG